VKLSTMLLGGLGAGLLVYLSTGKKEAHGAPPKDYDDAVDILLDYAGEKLDSLGHSDENWAMDNVTEENQAGLIVYCGEVVLGDANWKTIGSVCVDATGKKWNNLSLGNV
jgi:hypothetical protein